MNKLSYVVEESVTLRQWLRHRFPHIKYGSLQQSLRKGDIRINGFKSTPQASLKPGDEIQIWDKLTLDRPVDPVKYEVQVKVIEKNPDFWVIDKPYGIATQGGTKIKVCMVDVMSSMMGRKAYIVHRLDRYTTGLMVFATNSYAARDLSESIAFGWHKVYLAKIEGVPKVLNGRMESPVDSKEAVSEFKVLETNSSSALIAVKTITGRMHQIRQHCATHLYPLEGDLKYGSKIKTKMYLRCVELGFSFRGKAFEYKICG